MQVTSRPISVYEFRTGAEQSRGLVLEKSGIRKPLANSTAVASLGGRQQPVAEIVPDTQPRHRCLPCGSPRTLAHGGATGEYLHHTPAQWYGLAPPRRSCRNDDPCRRQHAGDGLRRRAAARGRRPPSQPVLKPRRRLASARRGGGGACQGSRDGPGRAPRRPHGPASVRVRVDFVRVGVRRGTANAPKRNHPGAERQHLGLAHGREKRRSCRILVWGS